MRCDEAETDEPLRQKYSPSITTAARFRSSTAFIVCVVAFSGFTDHFLYSLLVPILPEVFADRLGLPSDEIQYWISIFMVCEPTVVIITSPFFGYIVDRKRYRTLPFWFGLAVLAVSVTILGFARSIKTFLIARSFQGTATALLGVVGKALIVDAVPQERLGQYIGYANAVRTLGFTMGAATGGPLYALSGYNAVVWLASSVVAIDFILRLLLIEKRRAADLGLVVSTEDILSPREIEQNEANPLLPGEASGYSQVGKSPAAPQARRFWPLLKILRSPGYLISLWVIIVQGLLIAAFDTVLPKHVEDTLNWSSLEAGLILLPSAIPALAEPLFGLLVDKIGVRTVSVASFSLLTPCLVGLGFADNNTFRSKVLLLVLLTLVGVFSDATEPAMVVEGTAQLKILDNESSEESEAHELFGAMISLQTSSYFVGLLLGPVLGGSITIAAGWRVMCWTLALLSGATAVFSLGLGAPQGRS